MNTKLRRTHNNEEDLPSSHSTDACAPNTLRGCCSNKKEKNVLSGRGDGESVERHGRDKAGIAWPLRDELGSAAGIGRTASWCKAAGDASPHTSSNGIDPISSRPDVWLGPHHKQFLPEMAMN